MAVLSKGNLFSPALATDLINKVKGRSSLAVLSAQTPIPFNGTKEFTFSMDNEIDIVAENGKKSEGGVSVEPVTIVPIKFEYGARVSNEFMFASEEEQLDILKAFNEGFAKKVARGLDIAAFHGLNPRTGKASDVVGTNNFDAKVNQTVTMDKYFNENFQPKLDKFNADYEEIKKIAAGGGSGSSITVDSKLNSTSKNPVQNKVIKAELDKKAAKNEIPTNLSSLNEDETHQTVTAEEKKKWDGKSDFDGDFNSLNNIPNIPDAVIVDAELNETSTNAIQNQVVVKGLNKKANLTDLGINKYQKSETDATVTLENGSWTVFSTMTSLNVSMGDVDENKAFICGFQFTSGDTATSLTLNNCTLTSNSDSVESNKTYEVNILDGSAIIREI